MSGEQYLYNRPLPGAKVNMSHPLSNGIRGCWLLNDGMGLRMMDASPHRNDGTLVAFPEGTRPFNGLTFDGVDDYFSATNPTSLQQLSSSGMTLSCIFHTTYAAGVFKQLIGNIRLYAIGIKSGKLDTYDWGGGAWRDWGVTTVSDDVWRMVTLTLSNNVGQGYLDGQAEGTTFAFTSTGAGNAFGIGADNDGGAWQEFLPVTVLLAMVWGRVLSPDEIKALSISPYTPYGERLFV